MAEIVKFKHQQISSVDDLMAVRPAATGAEMAAAVNELLAQFPQKRLPEEQANARLRGYVIAIEGRAIAHIRKAVTRFMRGEVRGHNPRFAPGAAELGAAVKHVADEEFKQVLQRQRQRLQDEKNRRYAKPIPPKTPEQIARAKELVKTLKTSIAARNMGDIRS